MSMPEKLFQVSLNQVSLELERLHRPNSKSIDKMKKSLKSQRQISPVVVQKKFQNEYVLIDGFKRFWASKALGWKSLCAIDIQSDKYQAKAMVYLMNQSGSFSIIQEGLLIRELVEQDGLSQKEVGIIFERHKCWVSRRLGMIRNLQPEVIESFLMEAIPPGVGPTLARVSQCNQGDVVASIQKEALIPCEINLLVDLFCKTEDPGMEKAILQSPRQSISIIKKASRKNSWVKKMQIMRSNMEKFEDKICNNRHVISENEFNILSRKVNDVQTCVTEILSVMQKEEIWED